MKFPWSTIRGSWVATDPGCDDIGYVLRARYAKPNRAHKLEKVIDVREYDRKACKIIAYGTGYETDRVVRATMIREGGESYDLTFRAFPKNNGGAGSVGEGLASSVVMTFESDDSFAETKAIELKKIRDEVKMICYDP